MNTSELLIYQNTEGSIKIDVRLQEETVWLSQSQMQELFQKSKATISEHIKNIFEEGELDETSVVWNFRTTALDNKEYNETVAEQVKSMKKKVYNFKLLPYFD